jgi:hypothetical protein
VFQPLGFEEGRRVSRHVYVYLHCEPEPLECLTYP